MPPAADRLRPKGLVRGGASTPEMSFSITPDGSVKPAAGRGAFVKTG